MNQTEGTAGTAPMDVCDLSVVIPLLDEEENLHEIHRRLIAVLGDQLGLSFEIIFVDDGSRDASWSIIGALHDEDSRVKGLRFSRNFGHQYALKAGLDHARGDAVVTMDCDLQHPPELVAELVTQWRAGHEIVNTKKRATEGLGLVRRFITRAGYAVINTVSDTPVIPGAADFRLLDRKVVEHIRELKEGQLLLRGIVNWLGFSATTVEFTAAKRFAGAAKYTYGQLLGLVTSGLMSFSTAPLRSAIYIGFAMSALAFAYAGYLIVRWMTVGIEVPGWLTTVLLIIVLGGMNLLVLGVIGEYVAKIYDALKNRPSYIVAERIQ